jgi:RHS repeat-associated protein
VRNQISTVTDPDGRTYTYSYSATGSPVTMAQPNGVTTTYAHDSLNRLTNLTSKHGATTLQSYVYSLGATGLRTRIDEADGTARIYGYDGLYRLTTETVSGGGGPNYGKTFGYDAASNRLSQVTIGYGAASVAYTYDTRDRLLTENGTAYGWDDNGNMLSKTGEATYTWDFDDRLVRVTKADGTTVEHVYDIDGNRVRTSVTPVSGPAVVTNMLVDTTAGLSQVVAETDGAGTVQAYYVRAGDQLLAIAPGPMYAKYYLTDGLASVRVLADGNGNPTTASSYTAFGETLTCTAACTPPYGFAGEPFEQISNLSYNRARWLDSRTGRFLGIDPEQGEESVPASFQPYSYTAADPINYTDASGREYTVAHFAVAGLIGSIVSVALERPSNFRGVLSTAGYGFASGAAVLTGAALAELITIRLITATSGAIGAAAGGSVWLRPAFERGRTIHESLGENLPPNFRLLNRICG